MLGLGLLVLNYISSYLYQRFDLTQDKRYTLSKATSDIVAEVNETIYIDVYLEGSFPAEFKRLQFETQQLLEELKSRNRAIKFSFIDPLDDAEQLIAMGLEPSQLSVQQDGRLSEIVIFPWATVTKGERTEVVSLLSDTNAQSQEEQLENAIQHLEFAFADAIHKLNSEKEQTIAVLKGNGQLEDIFLYDFLSTLGNYYRLAQFTLDSVQDSPNSTLKDLTNYDLTLIAKPTERFSEKEKYVLDQYIMQGGKIVWMIDNVHAELDSLMQSGEMLAYPRDLNLTDLLFSYGVRINTDLVEDLYAAKIALATGNIGNQTQFSQFLWPYFPAIQSNNNHAITSQVQPVKLQFANSLDTLKNEIDKTVLLQSSKLSRSIGTPSVVSLNSIRNQANPDQFNDGQKKLAVLLEGVFNSAYKDRVKPFEYDSAKTQSEPNAMIIIADGDIAANQVSRGQPERLGIDKFTGERFGNKEFLMNCINFLLDDSGLIEVRNKTVDLKILDREKAFKNRRFYQFLNLLFPLGLLLLFGLLFTYFRRKKYTS